MTANQTKTKSKRRDKADRNTTTWTVPQKDSDTKYNIDSIVAFIENKDTNKKDKNTLKTTENRKEKNKNTANTNKKDVNRLKKSNSMEELKSSSKIEEEREIAQSEREKVSLRQQQQNAQKRNAVAAIDSGKDGKQQQQQTAHQQQQSNQQPSNKRGERRSWGTEELNYLGERDAGTDDRDSKKQKEKSKTNKKSEQNVSNTASIESIPMSIEAAEFHVVTKKKKTKKRQIFEEAKAKQQQTRDSMHQTQSGRNINSSSCASAKYQPSSNYTNDRDIYMNSLTTKENRRKSTSSMPPSDKSDSSDLDSIHSLPIESTQTCTPIISYAEIARKANPIEKMTNNTNSNAWPPVSSVASTNSSSMKNAETPDASNVSTCSSTLSAKSQGMKLSPLSDEKIVPTTDETKHFETPKASQGEHLKNQLQKSKSCDSDKCVTTMSLDQFPGLEKTVKPQKSHPNFASVLTSSPSVAEKSKPQSVKKSSVETNGVKENAQKVLKPIEDKVELKNTLMDVNHSKLVFVQNNAKAEEIANSDSSNLFVSLNASSTLKKGKKSQSNLGSTINSITSSANSLSVHRINNITQRTAAVIFSDRETSHENVSPLLFGDFNDDILQLMKQDENQMADSSKHNDIAPLVSSKFDPGYASNTSSTESHMVGSIVFDCI